MDYVILNSWRTRQVKFNSKKTKKFLIWYELFFNFVIFVFMSFIFSRISKFWESSFKYVDYSDFPFFKTFKTTFLQIFSFQVISNYNLIMINLIFSINIKLIEFKKKISFYFNKEPLKKKLSVDDYEWINFFTNCFGKVIFYIFIEFIKLSLNGEVTAVI